MVADSYVLVEVTYGSKDFVDKLRQLERDLTVLIADQAAKDHCFDDVCKIVAFVGVASTLSYEDASKQVGAYMRTNESSLPLFRTLMNKRRFGLLTLPDLGERLTNYGAEHPEEHIWYLRPSQIVKRLCQGQRG